MGKTAIPVIEFSREALCLENGNERWREVCTKVREACENHGCFLLRYDENIPAKLREDVIMAIKSLFDLPEETKTKYVNPKPYRSYAASSPFLRSFGLDDAHNLNALQAFTNLMWPLGNPTFCETLRVMSSKMLELNFLVLKMIFQSFGMEKHYDSHIENSTSVFRVMKYIAPPSDGGGDGGDSTIALPAHTDKNIITILCQNEIQGLEVQTKDGDWAQLMVPQDALVIVVGDALKAWSNGRLKAVRHRVVVRGKADRYSCGVFSMPKEESKVEVPIEFVDKDHPLLYKPFVFADYISYFVSKLSDDALEIYAGI